MTETMTQQEAKMEAQRRWGKRAHVFMQVPLFFVCDGIDIPPNGRGTSWEAAFADAERKEKHG